MVEVVATFGSSNHMRNLEYLADRIEKTELPYLKNYLGKCKVYVYFEESIKQRTRIIVPYYLQKRYYEEHDFGIGFFQPTYKNSGYAVSNTHPDDDYAFPSTYIFPAYIMSLDKIAKYAAYVMNARISPEIDADISLGSFQLSPSQDYARMWKELDGVDVEEVRLWSK